nr:hypothetical protein [Tanacetum cinerariifolium]
MDAPTILVSTDFAQGNFRDMIDIGVDVIHLVPVASVVFPTATAVRTVTQHEEAIRDIAEAENASLRAMIRTMEEIET